MFCPAGFVIRLEGWSGLEDSETHGLYLNNADFVAFISW
jgi:hypothetical protein